MQNSSSLSYQYILGSSRIQPSDRLTNPFAPDATRVNYYSALSKAVDAASGRWLSLGGNYTEPGQWFSLGSNYTEPGLGISTGGTYTEPGLGINYTEPGRGLSLRNNYIDSSRGISIGGNLPLLDFSAEAMKDFIDSLPPIPQATVPLASSMGNLPLFDFSADAMKDFIDSLPPIPPPSDTLNILGSGSLDSLQSQIASMPQQQFSTLPPSDFLEQFTETAREAILYMQTNKTSFAEDLGMLYEYGLPVLDLLGDALDLEISQNYAPHLLESIGDAGLAHFLPYVPKTIVSDLLSREEMAELFGNPSKFYRFYKKVNTGGDWDLKNWADFKEKYEFWGVPLAGKIYKFDVPGNLLYGFAGAAAGMSRTLLEKMAGLAQLDDDLRYNRKIQSSSTNYDYARDQRQIQAGYALYEVSKIYGLTEAVVQEVLKAFEVD